MENPPGSSSSDHNNPKKRPRDQAVVNLWERELGGLSTRNFAHRLGASEDLVLRLQLYKKLNKHRGCVNTISFNADGEVLVSGSDDRRVILWDWQTGNVKLSFDSGHTNNVFQAKIMPGTDDRSIITCAADGQVRHAQILERGVETTKLGRHHRQVHKLAIEPGSPHIFYTCGEDGAVKHFDLRTKAPTELFVCHYLERKRSYAIVQLNAIAIDPRNPNMFAIAGDDRYTRLFDMRKYRWDSSSHYGEPADYFCPPHLISGQRFGITGLAFSDQSELLTSYTDELIYLFTKDMGLGPNHTPPSASYKCDTSDLEQDSHLVASGSNTGIDEKLAPQVYKGHQNSETVKGVNFFGPKSEYVVSGSDCGRIFIWKKKGGQLVRVMEGDENIVNCVEHHPCAMVLASSGIENDIKMWIPNAIERATLPIKIDKVLRRPILWYAILDDDDDDEDDADSDADGDDDNDSDEDDVDDNEDGVEREDDEWFDDLDSSDIGEDDFSDVGDGNNASDGSGGDDNE